MSKWIYLDKKRCTLCEVGIHCHNGDECSCPRCEDDQCLRVDSSTHDVAKICGHEHHLHSGPNGECESCKCRSFSDVEEE